MSVLRKRLGDGIVSALSSGDSLIDSLLSGTGGGGDLNVELAPDDDVGADTALIGHCRVEMVQSDRLPFAEGENRTSKRRSYPFRMIFQIQSDVDLTYPGLEVQQALERIFADPRTFFRDHVTDTEGNLTAHAGRLELDEDFLEIHRGSMIRLEYMLRITVSHKGAGLTE